MKYRMFTEWHTPPTEITRDQALVILACKPHWAMWASCMRGRGRRVLVTQFCGQIVNLEVAAH